MSLYFISSVLGLWPLSGIQKLISIFIVNTSSRARAGFESCSTFSDYHARGVSPGLARAEPPPLAVTEKPANADPATSPRADFGG
jgi:hypothetical protein